MHLFRDRAYAQPSNTFKAGEPIYAQLDLPWAIKDRFEHVDSWSIGIEIRDSEGVILTTGVHLPHDVDPAQRVLRLPLVCEPDHVSDCEHTADFAYYLSKWKPGVHEVRLVVRERDDAQSRVLGLSALTITAQPDASAYRKLADIGYEGELKKTVMVAPAFVDPELDAGVRAAIQRAGYDEKVLRVVFPRPWRIQREPGSGVPLRRETNAAVAMSPKPGQSACNIRSFYVRQEFDGKDYGLPSVIEAGETWILCENVEK